MSEEKQNSNSEKFSSENVKNEQNQSKNCKCDHKNQNDNEEHKCHENGKHDCQNEKHKCHDGEQKHRCHELEAEINSLEEEISNLKSELENEKKTSSSYLSTASYYKSQADSNKKDLERFKERNKDIESQAKTKANESVAKKILPVIDSFDQAMLQLDSEIMKGFSMIYSSLLGILADLGATEIVCKNEKLNPEFHNCINTEETEDENLDGIISKVYQKGYKFADTGEVIRTATVSVYKLKAE